MKIRLNGEERSVPEGTTLEDLVKELRLTDRPFAVERNREVIPKTRLTGTPVQEGDRIEIVHFVGGG